MKYFEFNVPYYALIKAEDENSASQLYETISGGYFPHRTEKTRNEALNAFLMHEDGEFSALMREFNEDKGGILIVDRGIL